MVPIEPPVGTDYRHELAGGAVAYPAYDLGEDFSLSDFNAFRPGTHTCGEERLGRVQLQY